MPRLAGASQWWLSCPMSHLRGREWRATAAGVSARCARILRGPGGRAALPMGEAVVRALAARAHRSALPTMGPRTKGEAMPEASSEYSTVVEDILKLVWSAEEAGRDGVKPKDIGEHMGVVPSTTTENVQRLARQGLVTHERYGRVRLTEEGRAVALGMVRRHRLLETYLHEALGFSWDEVHEEAEILEHAVSERLLDRLDKVLGYPTRDPHGDPIPRADGSSDEVSGVPLDSLAVGDGGLVERLPDRDPQALRAWEEVGLVPGAGVVLVGRAPGALTVALDDGQMVQLEEALASGIIVRS